MLLAHEQIKKTIDSCLLLLAPRHPQRFDKVASLCSNQGFQMQRLSTYVQGDDLADVILVDSIGDLHKLFPLAKVAFIGGSLVPSGGHNMLEPATHGVPVLSGIHIDNFYDIGRMMETAGAMRMVKGREDLAGNITSLLLDEQKRVQMGKSARQVVERNSGVADKIIERIGEILR